MNMVLYTRKKVSWLSRSVVQYFKFDAKHTVRPVCLCLLSRRQEPYLRRLELPRRNPFMTFQRRHSSNGQTLYPSLTMRHLAFSQPLAFAIKEPEFDVIAKTPTPLWVNQDDAL